MRLSPDRWAAGGRALGRVSGRIWMVAGAVPGDEVIARIRKDHGRYVEATVDRIVEPSIERRVPPCPIQADCGGCPLMPVAEPRQHDAKLGFVRDALERIGRIGDPPVRPVRAPEPWLGYRSKIELTFGRERAGRTVLGFHRAESDLGIVDVEACAIADPRLNALLGVTRSFFLEGAGRHDRALRGGQPVRVVLRASVTGDDRLIAIRGPAGPFPSLAEFAGRAASADPSLTGVARIIALPGRRGGATVEAILGRPWIQEEILGTSFRVPAGVFLQIHPRAAEVLGGHVLALTARPETVMELYGGAGGFGLALARQGARVTIVEADPDAVACGLEAAARSGLDKARFVRGDVLDVLEGPEGRATPELLLADPPRTGFGRGVVERIGAMAPRRIVIVSCDPATLARDVAGLRRFGYVLEEVTPFDLFPQTAHVEAVAHLVRS